MAICLMLTASGFAGAQARGDLTGRFKQPLQIESHGRTYQYRDNLTTILLMGVDQTTEHIRSASLFRSGGQADFLQLMVIDSKAHQITAIPIDRDTMAQVQVLSVLGRPTGTRLFQICLSHAFGADGKTSAKNTVDAVSRLLHDIEIDFYVALSLDAIPTFNDLLGGVTVTLADDFTALDPDMRQGATVTLMGKQAEYYVRHRMGIGEGTNAARMQRQRNYLHQAGALLDEKLRDSANFIGKLFDALGDDLVTDMARGRMINEAYAARNYERTQGISIAGEHVSGDNGFLEFHADPEALKALVLDVFFEPVDERF